MSVFTTTHLLGVVIYELLLLLICGAAYSHETRCFARHCPLLPSLRYQFVFTLKTSARKTTAVMPAKLSNGRGACAKDRDRNLTFLTCTNTQPRSLGKCLNAVAFHAVFTTYTLPWSASYPSGVSCSVTSWRAHALTTRATLATRAVTHSISCSDGFEGQISELLSHGGFFSLALLLPTGPHKHETDYARGILSRCSVISLPIVPPVVAGKDSRNPGSKVGFGSVIHWHQDIRGRRNVPRL